MTGTLRGLGVLRARFRVLTVDAAQASWSWQVRLGPIALHLAHDLAATEDGCRAGLDITGPRPIVLGYLPLAGWAIRRLVQADREGPAGPTTGAADR